MGSSFSISLKKLLDVASIILRMFNNKDIEITIIDDSWIKRSRDKLKAG